MGRPGRGVVIPFPEPKDAERSWLAGGGRSQRLMDRALEVLGEAERELAALNGALEKGHPDPVTPLLKRQSG